MSRYCDHDSCRDHAIEELMFMGRTFGIARPDILAARDALLNSRAKLQVRCRHVDARSRKETEQAFVKPWVSA